MTHSISENSLASGRNLVTRWRILAQRRLDYLVELYQNGRWKLYYTESNFLETVQEARANLKVWQNLAPPDAVADKTVEVAIAQEDRAEVKLEQKQAGFGTARSLPQPSLLDGVRPEHNLRKL